MYRRNIEDISRNRGGALKLMLVFGTFFGALGLCLYPIAIQPYMNPDYYREIQKKTREGLDQEKIQPGDMKVWSDPFDRK